MLQIIHLSDWHIAFNNDVSYRNESYEIHNKTCGEIKNQLKNCKNNLIVITGDIFSYKSELRGFDVADFYFFMLSYANLAPVICIPGIFDGVPYRQIDLIKPLVENIQNNIYPIYYLNESKFYEININNLKLFVGTVNILNDEFYILKNIETNPYDNLIKKYNKDLDKRNYDFSLGIFHDYIEGSVYNSHHEYNISRQVTDCFDVVLSGCIHDYQTFRNCGYAGSLFQQHKKESNTKGFLIYNISKNTNLLNDTKNIIDNNVDNKRSFITEFINTHSTIKYKFIKISNNYGHITESHKNNSLSTSINSDIKYPRSIRLDFTNCDNSYIDNINNIYKTKYNNILINCRNKSEIEEDLKKAALKSIKIRSDNLNDIIENYIKDRLKDNEDINKILEIHKSISSSYVPEINFDRTRFNLIELDFDNVMIYGSNNNINFKKFSNGSLIGISAKNGIGKSTFITTIIAGLYGDIEKGNLSNLIRSGTNQYNIKLTLESNINISNVDIKNILKDKQKFNNDEEKINNENIKNGMNQICTNKDNKFVYEIQRSKGHKNISIDTLIYNQLIQIKGNSNMEPVIKYLIGDMDICLFTTFFQQQSSYDILSQTGVKQKEILEKIFHLDTLKKLKKFSEDKYKQLATELGSIKNPSYETIKNIEDKIEKNIILEEQNKQQIKILEKQLQDIQTEKEDYLSERPAIEKRFLDKEYIRKLKDQLAVSDINHKSEDDILNQITILHQSIIFVSSYENNKKLYYDNDIIKNDLIIFNNILSNLNSKISIIDVKISKLNLEMNSAPSFVKECKLEELEQKLSNLNNVKFEPMLETKHLLEEIKKLKNLSKSLNDTYIGKGSEPTFSPTCQCCQNNKNLFGICNINCLEKQLVEIEEKNKNNTKKNDDVKTAIKNLEKIISKYKLYNKNNEELLKIKNDKEQLIKEKEDVLHNIEITQKLINCYDELNRSKNNKNIKQNLEQFNKIEEYIKYSQLILSLEQKHKDVSSKLIELRSQTLNIQQQLILNKDLLIRKKEYEQETAVIKKELNYYEIYKNCFDNKNGIQVKLLLMKLPLVNETINQYLKFFDVDYEIEILLSANDNIEINILKRGSIESVKLCQGFIYDLIHLLLRFTLWKLYEGPLPNFLIFDETFIHADINNLYKLLDFFKYIKSTDNCPQFILINSHNIDLINNLDYILHIDHDPIGRISRINNQYKIKDTLKSNINQNTPLGKIDLNKDQFSTKNNKVLDINDQSIFTNTYCNICKKMLSNAKFIERHKTSKHHLHLLNKFHVV